MNTFAPELTKLVTILEVGQRQLSGRNGAFTMYDIRADDGWTYNTSKQEIAESAFSLRGQQAELTYFDKVNGQYTNHTLVSALPPRPNAAQQAQMTAQAQQFGPGMAQALQPPTVFSPDTRIQTQQTQIPSSDKDQQIHRQTAAKVAATLAAYDPSPQVFWNNVQDLTRYFDEGIIPGAYDHESLPF